MLAYHDANFLHCDLNSIEGRGIHGVYVIRVKHVCKHSGLAEGCKCGRVARALGVHLAYCAAQQLPTLALGLCKVRVSLRFIGLQALKDRGLHRTVMIKDWKKS